PSRARCNRPSKDGSSAFRQWVACIIVTSGARPEHGATFRSALLELNSEESVRLSLAVSTFLPCSHNFLLGSLGPNGNGIRCRFPCLFDRASLLPNGAQNSIYENDRRFDGFLSFLVPSKNGTWQYLLDCFSYFTPPHSPDNVNLLAGLNYVADSEQISDTPYRDYLYRLGNIPWGTWQPNITQMIPASAGTTFLNEALPLVTPAAASESVTVEIFAWKTSLFQRPLFRAPEEEHVFGIAMLRASRDPNDVPRMLSGNRTLLEKGRVLGGTFYPFTAAVLSRHDWKLHYGPYWDKLVNAKHGYDPFGVIASGPDLFRGHRDSQ
ncbi:MAG: hypothetical protein ACJ73N_18085, partial [Bryobacteraceae bacterium]